MVITNIVPKIKKDSAMIIGLDTSHPTGGSNFPTTASMVYSIDEDQVDYRGFVNFQEPRQELITGLKDWVFVSPSVVSDIEKFLH